MINFIIKKTIKNYEDIENNDVREKYGKVISLVGILSNLLLFASKFIIGLQISSVSVMADSFNNLSDTASSLISYVSFKISNKPPDKEHPFGHGRAEYIASLIVAFSILLLGYEFMKTSIEKIMNPTAIAFSATSIIILVAGVFLKVWLSYINKTVGDKINSSVLKATAVDARLDVIITCVTIFSIVFTTLTNILIDGYAGVIVALFLLYAGFSLARDMLSQLLGEAGDPKLAENIKKSILKYNIIIGVHDLIIHNYGPTKKMATIHVEVPESSTLCESHEVIDRIEKEIGKKFSIMLVIHMDPINIEDERLSKLIEVVNKALEAKELNMQAHEFKIITHHEKPTLVFELEVPHSLTKDEMKKLEQSITQTVKSVFEHFECMIKFESGYILE